MAKRTAEESFYAFGYSPAAVGMMDSRTAAVNAGFFTPHLSRGMSLLDIGCGPGSITVGLAEAVAPGLATGIDIEPSQVALGTQKASELGLGNCRFETASVLDLPFPDNGFDAVFGHTILLQFKNPEPVLGEISRVLRPGGVVGFREIDLGASLYSSDTDALRFVMSTLSRSIVEGGGDPDIGRNLPALVSNAGFEVLSAKATYACTPTLQARSGMYKAMSALWQQADFVARGEKLGWFTAEERAAVVAQLDREAKDPGRITGTTFVEVVGRMPA